MTYKKINCERMTCMRVQLVRHCMENDFGMICTVPELCTFSFLYLNHWKSTAMHRLSPATLFITPGFPFELEVSYFQ